MQKSGLGREEQLAAYVGTHQERFGALSKGLKGVERPRKELFARFQAAVEELDSCKQLNKAISLERDSLLQTREQMGHALEEERQRAAQARQELAEKPQGPAQLAVSDVLIRVSFKEAEQPLEVRPWDTDFEARKKPEKVIKRAGRRWFAAGYGSCSAPSTCKPAWFGAPQDFAHDGRCSEHPLL